VKHKSQVWHTVPVERELTGKEVVALVHNKLPKINQIDWHWSKRDNGVELSFRNKKDKTKFNRKPRKKLK